MNRQNDPDEEAPKHSRAVLGEGGLRGGEGVLGGGEGGASTIEGCVRSTHHQRAGKAFDIFG